MQKHPAVKNIEAKGFEAVTPLGFQFKLIPDDDELPRDNDGAIIYPALQSVNAEENEAFGKIKLHQGGPLNASAAETAADRAEAAADRAEAAQIAAVAAKTDAVAAKDATLATKVVG